MPQRAVRSHVFGRHLHTARQSKASKQPERGRANSSALPLISSADDILQMQQTIGNQAVLQLMKAIGNRFTSQEPQHESSSQTTQRKQANQTGLPDDLKTGMESLSGMDLSDIRVHYNSDKPDQVNALAYAQGSQIYLGRGQESHLPHEAWHVVQQKQGRVQPTMQMKKGVLVNDDSSLEREADIMGARALQRRSASQESSSHNQGCGCAACTGLQMTASPAKVQTAGATASSSRSSGGFQPIQRCVKCKKTSCKNGEKCGFDPTYDGFFDQQQANNRFVGPHSQTQNHSKKGVFESEHVLAKKAMQESGLPFTYSQEYTIQTDYDVHRKGQGGAGGGISSTGSSKTASQWAEHVGDLMNTNAKEAVRLGALEQINAHMIQGKLTMETLNAIIRWIDSQVDSRITSSEAESIKQEMIPYAMNYIK